MTASLSWIRHWGLTLVFVASFLVAIFRAMRSDPKDRVLLFEVLAFVTFFLGVFVLKVNGVSLPVLVVWLTFFFGFVFTALCFGIVNWRHRKKRLT